MDPSNSMSSESDGFRRPPAFDIIPHRRKLFCKSFHNPVIAAMQQCNCYSPIAERR